MAEAPMRRASNPGGFQTSAIATLKLRTKRKPRSQLQSCCMNGQGFGPCLLVVRSAFTQLRAALYAARHQSGCHKNGAGPNFPIVERVWRVIFQSVHANVA